MKNYIEVTCIDLDAKLMIKEEMIDSVLQNTKMIGTSIIYLTNGKCQGLKESYETVKERILQCLA